MSKEQECLNTKKFAKLVIQAVFNGMLDGPNHAVIKAAIKHRGVQFGLLKEKTGAQYQHVYTDVLKDIDITDCDY